MRVVAKIARPLDNAGNLKAIASVTLEDSFVVHGVKVLESQKGLFVAMPSTEFNSEYKDICHPTTKELREDISKAVLDAYAKTKEVSHERG